MLQCVRHLKTHRVTSMNTMICNFLNDQILHLNGHKITRKTLIRFQSDRHQDWIASQLKLLSASVRFRNGCELCFSCDSMSTVCTLYTCFYAATTYAKNMFLAVASKNLACVFSWCKGLDRFGLGELGWKTFNQKVASIDTAVLWPENGRFNNWDNIHPSNVWFNVWFDTFF